MRLAPTLKGCFRWSDYYWRRRRESNPCTGLCRPLPKPLGHSAARAYGPSRADDGIRTRDPHLGKVMLYQLSHVRTHLGAKRTVADLAARANSKPPATSPQVRPAALDPRPEERLSRHFKPGPDHGQRPDVGGCRSCG